CETEQASVSFYATSRPSIARSDNFRYFRIYGLPVRERQNGKSESISRIWIIIRRNGDVEQAQRKVYHSSSQLFFAPQLLDSGAGSLGVGRLRSQLQI